MRIIMAFLFSFRSQNLYQTSGTFPASPGSFLKKIYIDMTINIIRTLSNVVKISSNIKNSYIFPVFKNFFKTFVLITPKRF